MVLFFRNWDELGFRQLGGIPTVGSAGTSAKDREPYLHHPVAGYWLLYAARSLFGWKEWAFRLVPFLCLLASCGLTVLLASRFVPLLWALAAGLLLSVMGMIYGFGLMPNTDPLVLSVLLASVLLYGRTRSQESPRLRWGLFLLVFLGALVEWTVAFLVPALLLGELLLPKSERRAGEAARLIIPVILGWGVTVGIFLAAVGDSSLVFSQMLHAGTQASSMRAGWGQFFANQLDAWREFFGWPITLAAAVLLSSSLLHPRMRRSLAVRQLLPLTLPAILAIFLFRAPAFDHGFFWMPILLVLPTALITACWALWIRRPALASFCLIAVFGSSVWSGLIHEKLSASDRYLRLGELINEAAGPRDLVMTTEAIGPVAFYTKARMISPLANPEFIEMALQHRSEGKASFDRLFIWVSGLPKPQDQAIEDWAERHGERLPYPQLKAWIVKP